MKVAIVYDRVNKWGGAERVLLTLHELFPKAPLYTSIYNKDKASWAKIFPEIKTSFIQKIPFLKDNHELIPFLMPLAFQLHNFDEYDLVISVTSEFAKNITVKNGIHLCYCLTPTRYLWSGHDYYFQNKNIRKLLSPIINYLKWVDKKASKKPNKIIAISRVVQKRIKKYYQKDSQIIYPPVEKIKRLKEKIKNKNEYYLVVSRLVSYKKVDLAINAFNKLKYTLVIVGTGKEERKLKKLANKNVKFVGNPSDQKLARYYKNASALIFPQEEDFGIVAVEAQSFGTPVIAYKKGGALDIVSSKTGIFFEKQSIESLIKAVQSFKPKNFNKKDIINNSKKFSKKRFKAEFLQIVKNI